MSYGFGDKCTLAIKLSPLAPVVLAVYRCSDSQLATFSQHRRLPYKHFIVTSVTNALKSFSFAELSIARSFSLYYSITRLNNLAYTLGFPLKTPRLISSIEIPNAKYIDLYIRDTIAN